MKRELGVVTNIHRIAVAGIITSVGNPEDRYEKMKECAVDKITSEVFRKKVRIPITDECRG